MKRWSRARRQELTTQRVTSAWSQQIDMEPVQGKETRANYANSDFRKEKRAAYNITVKAKRAGCIKR